jgi:hypothetical protein
MAEDAIDQLAWLADRNGADIVFDGIGADT